MLKAAIAHNGTVMLDVVSPCVTFNDHEGSTKSYKYMKDHDEPCRKSASCRTSKTSPWTTIPAPP
jgi:pyruvate/2-oxoacid:ferredoxin oxidoreductase beta subunit